MATNEEIADKFECSGGYIDHMEKIFFIKSLDEARSDTANKIFKELAKICRQQLEPAQLERFAKEFFDAKDESEAFAIAQKFSKIVFYADEYKAVKNKWVE